MHNKLWLCRRGVAMSALCALLCLVSTGTRAAEFTKYHNYEELTAALRDLVGKHADIARLVEAGKTRQGRTIWAVEIANPKGAPVESRPAILVAANLEGDQLMGSELALYQIDFLLGNYATNADVKKKIDSNAFYILPRINPDAAEMMFAAIKGERKTNFSPADDDFDGRIDEDGPEDLNKDGVITVMRVKDPHGQYMIHPDDPRLMRKADPARGETGSYAIYWEGTDKDNDGFIGEDGPGGVDINRNFQHKYPYNTPDAGKYMVSEPESLALINYVLGKPNVAMILTFGESDNLIVAPNRRGELGPAQTIDLLSFANDSAAGARRIGMLPTAPAGFGRGMMFFEGEGPGGRGGQQPQGGRAQMGSRRPAERIDPADIEYFRTVSDKYRAITGIRSTPAVRTPAGAFFEYGYYQFGVPSFSTPGWGLPAAPGGPGGGRGGMMQMPADEAQAPAGAPGMPGAAAAAAPSGGTAVFDLRLLKWMDAEKLDGFVNWTPYKHPTLGDVEIGGFRPYVYSNPPAARLAELGKSHADFLMYLSTLFARVAVAQTTVTSLGGGLFQIKAEIENSGFLPTATAQGVVNRHVKPTLVQLAVDPKDIVSGAAKNNFFPTLAGSGRRQSYEWVIKGKPGASVVLKVVSENAGTDSATLTLK